MQVIFRQINGEFENGRLCCKWEARLLKTGKVVGYITEWLPNGSCQVLTFGNGVGSRRYRTAQGVDDAQSLVTKWAKRRFAGRRGHLYAS